MTCKTIAASFVGATECEALASESDPRIGVLKDACGNVWDGDAFVSREDFERFGVARPRRERAESEVLYLGGDSLATLARIESGELSLRWARRHSRRERRRRVKEERRSQRWPRSGGFDDGFDDPAARSPALAPGAVPLRARRSPQRRPARARSTRRMAGRGRATSTSASRGDPPDGSGDDHPAGDPPPRSAGRSGNTGPLERRLRGTLATAVAYLLRALEAGQRPSAELMAEGMAAGHSERTLHRARRELGVQAIRVGYGPGAVYLMRLDGAAPWPWSELHKRDELAADACWAIAQ